MDRALCHNRTGVEYSVSFPGLALSRGKDGISIESGEFQQYYRLACNQWEQSETMNLILLFCIPVVPSIPYEGS